MVKHTGAGIVGLVRLGYPVDRSCQWLTCLRLPQGTAELPYLLQNRITDGEQIRGFIGVGISHMAERLQQLGQHQLLLKLTRLQLDSVRLLNTYLRRPAAFRVLCHGDYRDGNLLLRETPDGDWQVRAVDWQTSRLGCPALDLLYLMLFSLPRSKMAEIENDTLDIYRRHFNQKLQQLGCSRRYSEAKLCEDFQATKLVGLVWCLAAVQFWTRVPNWVEQTTDLAMEVDQMGLLDQALL